jgi:hypothetical protein
MKILIQEGDTSISVPEAYTNEILDSLKRSLPSILEADKARVQLRIEVLEARVSELQHLRKNLMKDHREADKLVAELSDEVNDYCFGSHGVSIRQVVNLQNLLDSHKKTGSQSVFGFEIESIINNPQRIAKVMGSFFPEWKKEKKYNSEKRAVSTCYSCQSDSI